MTLLCVMVAKPQDSKAVKRTPDPSVSLPVDKFKEILRETFPAGPHKVELSGLPSSFLTKNIDEVPWWKKPEGWGVIVSASGVVVSAILSILVFRLQRQMAKTQTLHDEASRFGSILPRLLELDVQFSKEIADELKRMEKRARIPPELFYPPGVEEPFLSMQFVQDFLNSHEGTAMSLFNYLEYYSLAVNHKLLKEPVFTSYFDAGVLKWHDDWLILYPKWKDDADLFPEFKKLYKVVKTTRETGGRLKLGTSN